MAEPITVLYVDHASAMGGAEHSLLALLTALDRARFRPVLAAPPGPLADAASAAGVPVRRLPLPRLQRQVTSPLHLARGVQALRRVAHEERAAILHGNVLRATVYAAPAARATGRPLVWHVRDIHRRGPAAWWLCRQTDAIIAISRAVATALPCARRAAVVYNPVTLRPAAPRTRAELGLPTSGPLVAMVASMRRWKGHEAFLEMAARVAARPAARFVVVGGAIFDDDEPGYAEALEARAAALGLAERVVFLGQRDDLPDLWPHLAILVHPAQAEPFGRVAAEALLAGVPVVAFRDGGLPEIVDDGATGLLTPPGDLGALADGVVRLLDNPELRARLGRSGQERAARRFAPAGHARAVEQVYDGVLAARAGRVPTAPAVRR
jgi:glycosyltransferase involved in cell wall biosynthesis